MFANLVGTPPQIANKKLGVLVHHTSTILFGRLAIVTISRNGDIRGKMKTTVNGLRECQLLSTEVKTGMAEPLLQDVNGC